MRRLSREIRRPVTFALNQNDVDKDLWREILRLVDEAHAPRARASGPRWARAPRRC